MPCGPCSYPTPDWLLSPASIIHEMDIRDGKEERLYALFATGSWHPRRPDKNKNAIMACVCEGALKPRDNQRGIGLLVACLKPMMMRPGA